MGQTQVPCLRGHASQFVKLFGQAGIVREKAEVNRSASLVKNQIDAIRQRYASLQSQSSLPEGYPATLAAATCELGTQCSWELQSLPQGLRSGSEYCGPLPPWKKSDLSCMETSVFHWAFAQATDIREAQFRLFPARCPYGIAHCSHCAL